MPQRASQKTLRLNRHHGEHAGPVHIRLIGIDHQKIVSTSEVLTALTRLPNAHLTGLKEIRFDPRRTTIQDTFNRFEQRIFRRAKAVYRQWQRSVTIFAFDDYAEFLHLLYHEIGHFVYFHIIGSKAKKQWVTDIYLRDRFVTVVAAKNAAEDFAECYAVYLLKPEKLKTLPNKHKFISANVFKSFRPNLESTIDISL